MIACRPLSALALATLAACAADATTGTVALPLTTTTAEGTIYRLRDGSFQIATPGGLAIGLSTEDAPDATALHVDLDAGNYNVMLADGWRLERNAGGAGFEPVAASMVSSNPRFFDVVDGASTAVSFIFRVDGEGNVALGGGVDIGIDVYTPCDPVAQTGCAAGERCTSVGLDDGNLITACAPAGTVAEGGSLHPPAHRRRRLRRRHRVRQRHLRGRLRSVRRHLQLPRPVLPRRPRRRPLRARLQPAHPGLPRRGRCLLLHPHSHRVRAGHEQRRRPRRSLHVPQRLCRGFHLRHRHLRLDLRGERRRSQLCGTVGVQRRRPVVQSRHRGVPLARSGGAPFSVHPAARQRGLIISAQNHGGVKREGGAAHVGAGAQADGARWVAAGCGAPTWADQGRAHHARAVHGAVSAARDVAGGRGRGLVAEGAGDEGRARRDRRGWTRRRVSRRGVRRAVEPRAPGGGGRRTPRRSRGGCRD